MTSQTPPSSRGTPPASSRSMFPLITTSREMEDFIDLLMRSLREPRSMTILVGPNRLELNSLIDHLSRFLTTRGYSNHVVSEGTPDLNSGHSPRVIIYPNGNKIDPLVQAQVVSPTCQTAVIACVSGSIQTLTRQPKIGIPLWSKDFSLRMHLLRHWPMWKERTKDQEHLVKNIHSTLRAPDGKRVPPLSINFLSTLLQYDFVGTDEVEETIKDAFTRYLSRGENGYLEGRHVRTKVRRLLREDSRGERTTPV